MINKTFGKHNNVSKLFSTLFYFILYFFPNQVFLALEIQLIVDVSSTWNSFALIPAWAMDVKSLLIFTDLKFQKGVAIKSACRDQRSSSAGKSACLVNMRS